MKSLFKFSILFAYLFLASHCQKSENARYVPAPQEPANDSGVAFASDSAKVQTTEAVEIAQMFSTAASGRPIADTAKKFVRTAQMKFKTDNVLKTTLAIEDIAVANGGFVTQNHFAKTGEYRQVVRISVDSSLETQRFTAVNHLQVRVPYWKLDTTLRSIGRFALYLNYRIVNAEDVELDLLENQINRLRSERFADEMNEVATGKSAIEAKKMAQQSRTAADVARMETLRIADKIQYSTIDLDIYQNESAIQRLIANEKPVAAYKSGFWSDIADALRYGWDWMKEILIGIIGLLPFVLIACLVLWGYKKLRVKAKN